MKPYYLLLPLVLCTCTAWAAQPLPSAGTLLPPVSNDAVPPPLPSLELERSLPLAGTPSTPSDARKLRVQHLRIKGATVFLPSQLLAYSGFVAGEAYTLQDLQALAARMEHYYRNKGYPVAQAYLPAQDVSGGEVTITIHLVEGHYGQVLLRNQSRASSALLSDMLQDLQPGAVVQGEVLDSHLLLLSDLPGVQIKSALVPGAAEGTSDLLVDVLPTRRVTGSVDADNAGNYYTGAIRVGASMFLNEPSGEGDLASLRLQTSGEGLNYFRAAYHLQIGSARVGAAWSSMEYSLGRDFENLLANGTARTLGFFANYPLVRSRTANLLGSVSYDNKRFEDRLDAVSSMTEKFAHVFSAGLAGDLHESWGAGAVTAFNLTLSGGNLQIQTAPAREFDASTAKSHGGYGKLSFGASQLQNVRPNLQLYAGINGQWASKNLDASEKMPLGGLSAVRAYPEGEGYGDEGYVLALEARYVLPRAIQPSHGALQGFAFVDAGSVALNKSPWTTEPNQRHLSAAGLGLSWSANNRFLVKVVYAHKLGDEAARSAPDATDRLWLQATAYF